MIEQKIKRMDYAAQHNEPFIIHPSEMYVFRTAMEMYRESLQDKSLSTLVSELVADAGGAYELHLDSGIDKKVISSLMYGKLTKPTPNQLECLGIEQVITYRRVQK